MAISTAFGFTGYAPSFHPDDVEHREVIQRRLYCLLGDAGSIIPISSLNGYYRSDNSASFTVVCPLGAENITKIIASINSYFKIKFVETFSDGVEETKESIRFNINQPTYDRGARSFSISIPGTGTLNPPLPRRRFIFNDSSIILEALQANGLRRYRIPYIPDIYPNDSIVFNNVETVIGRVTHTVNARQMTLEITEIG